MTATDLVVSCRPEKGNLRDHNHKFFYDIHSEALIGQLEYQPFSRPRLFASDKAIVLVGSDRKRIQALQFDPPNRSIPFHIWKGTWLNTGLSAPAPYSAWKQLDLDRNRYEIVRVGDSLILATDCGAALIEHGKARRFMIDQTQRGQLQVSEASATP